MLELLKIILPALVVFATVYFILNRYFNQRLSERQMELHQARMSESLSMKLQAYERLILFCDRISPQALVYRLKDAKMTAGGLHTALLMAVQQEYEHNMAQQIYVSDKLWEIITVAKNEVQELISKASEDVDMNGDAGVLISNLGIIQGAVQFEPNEQAKMAIKQEVKMLL